MFINLIQASITKSYHFSWLKTKIDFHNQPVATFKDAYTLINEVYKARNELSPQEIDKILSRTERTLWKSKGSNQYIDIYNMLSRLNVIDNFQRKTFIDKICESLGELSDSKFINTSYFLFTHAPYHDLSSINNHSLRLNEISQKIGKNNNFAEYIYAMKADFVLKQLGFDPKIRTVPKLNVDSISPDIQFELSYCLAMVNPVDQNLFDLLQRMLYRILDSDSSIFLKEQANRLQQDMVVYDPFINQKLCQLYELVSQIQCQIQLFSKINAIFWRKQQQSALDFCSCTRILYKIYGSQIQSNISISKTISDMILQIEEDDLKNVPVKSIIRFLQIFNKRASANIFLNKFDSIICQIDITQEELQQIANIYENKPKSKALEQLILQSQK